MAIARPDRAFFLIAAASALAYVSLPPSLPGGHPQDRQPFVDEISSSADQERLASAIVRLGSTLGLDTVAEGIERKAQRDRLRSLRCRYGQGYFFSPPMPAADVECVLQRSLVA